MNSPLSVAVPILGEQNRWSPTLVSKKWRLPAKSRALQALHCQRSQASPFTWYYWNLLQGVQTTYNLFLSDRRI